jgi:hypothetical protein
MLPDYWVTVTTPRVEIDVPCNGCLHSMRAPPTQKQ